ncbi:MAG: hypothetical protein QM785_07965 [Pyrinomonadaceae bacterium]
MHDTIICKTCSQPLRLKLPVFAPDEKLAFVERVCSLLVESRFSYPRPYRQLVHLTDEPERADHIFFEMTCEGPLPSYMIDFVNDGVIPEVIGDLIERRVGIFTELPSFVTSKIQARGSP